MPSRHTTRCGTERIGYMVHTVRVPVRKLARPARPASPSASSACSSDRLSTVCSAASSPARAVSTRYACPGCQLSVALVAVSWSIIRFASSSQSGTA